MMATTVLTLLFVALAGVALFFAVVAHCDGGSGRWLAVIAAVFAGLAVWGAADIVRAQDGHSRWHDYYQNWKQPGTELSCCNARVLGPNGEDLTGDCEPTRGEVRNRQWYFWLRQESRWIAIPDAKIIRERNPSGEEGHLCAVKQMGGWVILCAVPPDTGG